jgi:hypothetical protein
VQAVSNSSKPTSFMQWRRKHRACFWILDRSEVTGVPRDQHRLWRSDPKADVPLTATLRRHRAHPGRRGGHLGSPNRIFRSRSIGLPRGQKWTMTLPHTARNVRAACSRRRNSGPTSGGRGASPGWWVQRGSSTPSKAHRRPRSQSISSVEWLITGFVLLRRWWLRDVRSRL